MIPLAAEETRDPRKDIPKGMIRGVVCSIAVAFVVVFLGASMPPGIDKLAWAPFPLVPAMQSVFKTPSPAWNLLALPLIALSLKASIYAYGRVYFSLGRAGLLPDMFTTVTQDGVPYVAITIGSVSGCMMSLLLLVDKGVHLHVSIQLCAELVYQCT